MSSYEVWMRLEGQEEPKLIDEFLRLEGAKALTETLQLTTRGIKRLFIAHLVTDKWEQHTGQRNLM